MGEVHPQARVAFVDDRLRGAVETEPGEDQIVVAAGGGPDHLLDHLRGDRAVLRAEHDADRGIALRVVIGLATLTHRPSAWMPAELPLA